MTEPITLTPLSEAVERLKGLVANAPHYPESADIQLLLDAVAEGREKITAMRPVVDAAIGVMDQLNSFNDPRHPEVHRQHLRLQAALDQYYQSPVAPPPAPTEPG